MCAWVLLGIWTLYVKLSQDESFFQVASVMGNSYRPMRLLNQGYPLYQAESKMSYYSGKYKCNLTLSTVPVASDCVYPLYQAGFSVESKSGS